MSITKHTSFQNDFLRLSYLYLNRSIDQIQNFESNIKLQNLPKLIYFLSYTEIYTSQKYYTAFLYVQCSYFHL